jgi:hypothetical protein
VVATVATTQGRISSINRVSIRNVTLRFLLPNRIVILGWSDRSSDGRRFLFHIFYFVSLILKNARRSFQSDDLETDISRNDFGTQGTKQQRERNGEAANKLVKFREIKILEQICFDTDNRVSDIKLVYDRYTSLKIFSIKTLLGKTLPPSLAYRLTRDDR